MRQVWPVSTVVKPKPTEGRGKDYLPCSHPFEFSNRTQTIEDPGKFCVVRVLVETIGNGRGYIIDDPHGLGEE